MELKAHNANNFNALAAQLKKKNSRDIRKEIAHNDNNQPKVVLYINNGLSITQCTKQSPSVYYDFFFHYYYEALCTHC